MHDQLFRYEDALSGSRISARPGSTFSHLKYAEAAQLHATFDNQRFQNRIKRLLNNDAGLERRVSGLVSDSLGKIQFGHASRLRQSSASSPSGRSDRYYRL